MNILEIAKKALKKDRAYLKDKSLKFEYNSDFVVIHRPGRYTWHEENTAFFQIGKIGDDGVTSKLLPDILPRHIPIHLINRTYARFSTIQIPITELDNFGLILVRILDNQCAFYHDCIWYPDIPGFLDMADFLFEKQEPVDEMLLLADWLDDTNEPRLAETLRWSAENFVFPRKYCRHEHLSVSNYLFHSFQHYPLSFLQNKEVFYNLERNRKVDRRVFNEMLIADRYTHDLDFHFWLRNLQQALEKADIL